MLSGTVRKKIPKSLEECMRTDETSAMLLDWVEFVESVGMILLWVILGCGFISSITIAIAVGEIGFFDGAGFLMFLVSMVGFGIVAAVEYVIYKFIVMILCAQATIVLNTRVTADTMLFVASNNSAAADGNAPVNAKTNEDKKFPEKSALNIKYDAGKVMKTEGRTEAETVSEDDIAVTVFADKSQQRAKIVAFLRTAETCSRVSEIKANWQTLNMADNPLFAEFNKMILDSANVERIYGFGAIRMSKLVNDLKKCYIEYIQHGQI